MEQLRALLYIYTRAASKYVSTSISKAQLKGNSHCPIDQINTTSVTVWNGCVTSLRSDVYDDVIIFGNTAASSQLRVLMTIRYSVVQKCRKWGEGFCERERERERDQGPAHIGVAWTQERRLRVVVDERSSASPGWGGAAFAEQRDRTPPKTPATAATAHHAARGNHHRLGTLHAVPVHRDHRRRTDGSAGILHAVSVKLHLNEQMH